MRVENKGISAAQFRDTMSTVPAAVTIVTTMDLPDRPAGMCAISFCSVSLDPPLILVCLDKGSRTLPILESAGAFVVNFLGAEHRELAAVFASKADDKFHGVRWHHGAETDQPVLDDAIGHFECSVWRVVEAGDHQVVIGLVQGGARPHGLSSLVYWNREFVDLIR